jgi:uncharacterized protein (TIGR02001 family)
MRSKHLVSLGGVVALCGALMTAALPSTASAQLTGTASLTSDYVWRGSSQTREDPAVQAGLKYAHASGLYASVWGSNVKFRPDNGAGTELDLAVGWAGKIADDWALDAYLLRYQYPSADTKLNWNELNLAVTWRENYWVAVGHSTNTMAGDTTGTYVLLGARHALNDQWRIEGTVARYVLDSDYADSYTHGALSVVWAFRAPFELRATLHATDSAARRLFPGMAGTRGEFALQASF